MTQAYTTFLALVFIVPLASLTLWCLFIVWRGFKCAEWPTATGSVLTAELVVDDQPEYTTYNPVVTYRYAVAGCEYVGTRFRFGLQYFSFPEPAHDAMRCLVLGQPVLVRHHPHRHDLCVLKPGVSSAMYFTAFMPAFFAVIVFLSLI